MEQDGGSVWQQLPPLSAKYPWFVSQNLGADGDQCFYTLHDPLTKYQCQIPELHERRIRGYYHGWVVLSDRLQSVVWSLWNPVTSEMIDFLPWISKDGDSISECCLSAPPEDPSSVLLLTRTNTRTFVMYHLQRKELGWIEKSYSTQMEEITGQDGDSIHNLTCCNNGQIYALGSETIIGPSIIKVDILPGEEEQVWIELSIFGRFSVPPSFWICNDVTHLLKGHGTDLFIFTVGCHDTTPQAAKLMKLDMTRCMEEEENDIDELCDDVVVDMGNAIFFVDLGGDNLVYYRPGIASELGGYIHIRDRVDNNILYSYHVKENTISLSKMPWLVLPTSNLSLWECSLQDDAFEENQVVVTGVTVTSNEIGLNESNLLGLPFHILEEIMEHCVSVEYFNFRATCKRCKLAAPLKKLPKFSVVSPWLMVLDQNANKITYTDPTVLGEKYFMKNREISYYCGGIHCSRFGWLLYFCSSEDCLCFYNPLTRQRIGLPDTPYKFNSACFSAPPTPDDWMVVGFSEGAQGLVLLHCVAREKSWRAIRVNAEPEGPLRFPTLFGEDLYALDGDGKVIGFIDFSRFVEARAPISCCTSPPRHYLMKRGQELLMVIVGKFGEGVEVYKLDVSKQEWEKIDSLGNHMIYICDVTCLCIEAKTREMENKIYFPILHSKNKSIVFYSLESCTYQTYNGENIQQKDFFGTTSHLSDHVWIEPNWV